MNGAYQELRILERVEETRDTSVTEGNADVRERQERLRKLRRKILTCIVFRISCENLKSTLTTAHEKVKRKKKASCEVRRRLEV